MFELLEFHCSDIALGKVQLAQGISFFCQVSNIIVKAIFQSIFVAHLLRKSLHFKNLQIIKPFSDSVVKAFIRYPSLQYIFFRFLISLIVQFPQITIASYRQPTSSTYSTLMRPVYCGPNAIVSSRNLFKPRN